MITWAPVKINTTWLPRLFLLGSFLDYLVSCRMIFYGLPSIKRSPRLIIVGIVHKVNCFASKYKNSQVQINLTWRTKSGGSAFPQAERCSNIIKLPQESAVFEEPFSTRVPWTPLIHRVNLRFLLLPTPKSHPHCQVCPWQTSASIWAGVQKNNKIIRLKCMHQWCTPLLPFSLDTLKQLPSSPSNLKSQPNFLGFRSGSLTSSAYFHRHWF